MSTNKTKKFQCERCGEIHYLTGGNRCYSWCDGPLKEVREALPRYETRQRVTTPAEDIAAAVEAVIWGGPRPAAAHSVGEWIPTAGDEL